MTPEEQRIAIAEKCGWEKGSCGWWAHPTNGALDCPEFNLPNYPADLNAMHEAEKMLSEDQIERYVFNCLLPDANRVEQVCSTAAQRAEAFCRLFWPERFKA